MESGDIDTDPEDPAYWDGRVHSLEIWFPRGDEDMAARLAFAYIASSEVSTSVALFLRVVLAAVATMVRVELLLSSRGGHPAALCYGG